MIHECNSRNKSTEFGSLVTFVISFVFRFFSHHYFSVSFIIEEAKCMPGIQAASLPVWLLMYILVSRTRVTKNCYCAPCYYMRHMENSFAIWFSSVTTAALWNKIMYYLQSSRFHAFFAQSTWTERVTGRSHLSIQHVSSSKLLNKFRLNLEKRSTPNYWQALVNTVMFLSVPPKPWKFD